MLVEEKDFISSEHKFKDDKCNPPHDVNVSLSKQRDEDGEENFWITVWGKWGDNKVDQVDLSFNSKKECVKFLQEMIAVVKTDYPTIKEI